MYIVGLDTAVPKQSYTQQECLQALASSNLYHQLSNRSQIILKKVLGNGKSGIKTRHLALEPLNEFIHFNPDALYQRFLRHAPLLASEAAMRAMVDAGITSKEVDAIIVSTCTGYLCPGLSSYMIEILSLRNDVVAFDLVGHGCGAALPNLQLAETLLSAKDRFKTVLSICVEICSAAFYLDDDPGVLISTSLFGDGAAAVVLKNNPMLNQRSICWENSYSMVVPEKRDLLRFEQRHGMLRNILTPPVPVLAARYVNEIMKTVLARYQISSKEIGAWILHTGGRDVLNELAHKMDLDENDLRWSREVLNEYGNMSSPSVLFVLKQALNGNAPDGWWWLSAFGAGFSCHGALLRVNSDT